jgi:hypothetical protein
MGKKFGFSFSWKRALGISAAKGKLSRLIGIPLTKSGRQRKAGRLLGDAIGSTLIAASHTSSHTNANEPTPDYSAALNLVRQVRNEISSGEGFAPGSILGQGLLEHGGRRCYTCNLVFGRDIRRCGKCGSVLN